MDKIDQTGQVSPFSDRELRSIILVGFSLLCFVNMACFFPHALMPALSQEQYRAFNFSATLMGIAAALGYSLALARGQTSLLAALSIAGHVVLVIGITLAGFADPSRGTFYTAAIGMVLGTGLSFSMLYWFCMLSLLPDSQVMSVQGFQALGGELLFIATVAIGSAILRTLMFGACLISAACVLLFLRRITCRGWTMPEPMRPVRTPDPVDRWNDVSGTVASPFVGLAIVSFLYGAITAVIMGPEGSTFAATASLWGAPLGATLFLAWSTISKTKDFTLAMKVFFFVLMLAVAIMPFDIVSLIMSAGYQICSLLLFSYLIISTRELEYRLTSMLVVLGYIVMHIAFLVGMYLPSAFSVSSYQALISSTSLILFLAYLLFAGILFFTSRERRLDHQAVARALEERDLIKEQTEQGMVNVAAEAGRLQQEACEKIAQEAGLTKRETEVMMLLAKGRDLSHISHELYLARNTIKGYIKKIYAKLDVHTKQELIDLVEDARRSHPSV